MDMVVDCGETAVELLEDFVYVSVGYWTRFYNLLNMFTCQRTQMNNIVTFYSIREFYKDLYLTRDAELVLRINEQLPQEYVNVV